MAWPAILAIRIQMASLQQVSRSLLEDSKKAGLAVFLQCYKERFLLRLQTFASLMQQIVLLEMSIPALPVA